eukprot:1161915-Pelagomonas_calceolata.AAC.9
MSGLQEWAPVLTNYVGCHAPDCSDDFAEAKRYWAVFRAADSPGMLVISHSTQGLLSGLVTSHSTQGFIQGC